MMEEEERAEGMDLVMVLVGNGVGGESAAVQSPPASLPSLPSLPLPRTIVGREQSQEEVRVVL